MIVASYEQGDEEGVGPFRSHLALYIPLAASIELAAISAPYGEVRLH